MEDSSTVAVSKSFQSIHLRATCHCGTINGLHVDIGTGVDECEAQKVGGGVLRAGHQGITYQQAQGPFA